MKGLKISRSATITLSEDALLALEYVCVVAKKLYQEKLTAVEIRKLYGDGPWNDMREFIEIILDEDVQ